jgi:L-asparagine transporter-like permease
MIDILNYPIIIYNGTIITLNYIITYKIFNYVSVLHLIILLSFYVYYSKQINKAKSLNEALLITIKLPFTLTSYIKPLTHLITKSIIGGFIVFLSIKLLAYDMLLFILIMLLVAYIYISNKNKSDQEGETVIWRY